MSSEQFPTERAESTGTNAQTQKRSRKFNIQAPILENTISVLQQLAQSQSPPSPEPRRVQHAHPHSGC